MSDRGLPEESQSIEDVIAFVRCEFVDEQLRMRYQPMWVRLLAGERILTVHHAEAWVMNDETAEEVAANCNNDPDWQRITVGPKGMKSGLLAVTYNVVKYRRM